MAMENTPQLYDTLVHVLSQPTKWLDQRHRKTMAWMMVGLMHSGWINLTAWAPYVVSRARDAQSTVRRFRRWLDNDKIDVLSLYGPLLQQALAEWGEQALYVALDTSMLWDTYCLSRLAVIYRGRAVPLVQLGGKKDPFYIRPFEAIMTPDAQTILLATKRSWRCLVPSPLPCRSRRRTIKRCT